LLAKQAPSKKKKKKRDATSLRKAPQAPKRFRSSYICFFTAKQSEIKKELGELATVAQISKRSAQLWKELSTEDRGFWDDVAARDKQRYLAEKASYIGPWQIPYKRAKKDPSAPKRPMSAFLHFSRGRRSKIKEKNPDMKNTEVSKILGNLWRNSTEEERRPYVENEKVERGKYKTAMSKWKEEYQKRQKVESEELEQRYYPRASLQQQHYQQHVPSQNEYAQKAIHENHAQQTLKEYPYSYFQPPSTGFAGSRQGKCCRSFATNQFPSSSCLLTKNGTLGISVKW
jgi:high mobility group protein B1